MTALTTEDTTVQEDAVVAAGKALAEALAALAVHAKLGARSATTKRGTFDLTPVYAAVAAVRRAEEAYDFAALDLSTARGDDA